jgi:hypothetical protein
MTDVKDDLLEQLGDARDKYNEAMLFIDYLRAKLEYYPSRYENTIEAVVRDIRKSIDSFKKEGTLSQPIFGPYFTAVAKRNQYK